MRKGIGIALICLIVLIVFIVIFTILFPRKYRDEINELADKYNLDRYLVASVINIESSYDVNALSKAGAMGLMQLLPSTASEMASRLKIDFEKNDLYDVRTNIELGCYYLSYLMDMFDENVVNVLSAYNWGLQNVKDWIAKGNVGKDGEITNIPIAETQNYIKKFESNAFVYRNIYKY